MRTHTLRNLTFSLAIALPFAASIRAQDAPAQGADSAFLQQAGQACADQIRLGELATQNASNQQVKDFARKAMDENSRINDELKTLAAAKNVSLPAEMGLKDQAGYKTMSSKRGEEFDKIYIASMVKNHQNHVAAFEKEANDGKDPDVKAFAAKALPILRDQLKSAQTIAGEVAK